jgi:hypothetical protein
MKPLRIATLLRTMFAALALLLAGCDDGVNLPRSLTGSWLTVAVNPGGSRLEDRLELTPDGRYVWTTVTFAPAGRTQDGMLAWFSRSGDWRVEGDRLALRTSGGMAWEHGGGWSQLDYTGDWHRDHRLRRLGERMVLEELLPPEMSRAPRTYTFDRVEGALDTPQP